MSLGRLPYEIIFLIVQDLGLEDIFHLSTTCKALSWILYEDRTCRSILEVSRNPLQKKKKITAQCFCHCARKTRAVS